MTGDGGDGPARPVQLDLFGRQRRPEDDGFEVVEVRQEGPWKVEVSRRR